MCCHSSVDIDRLISLLISSVPAGETSQMLTGSRNTETVVLYLLGDLVVGQGWQEGQSLEEPAKVRGVLVTIFGPPEFSAKLRPGVHQTPSICYLILILLAEGSYAAPSKLA